MKKLLFFAITLFALTSCSNSNKQQAVAATKEQVKILRTYYEGRFAFEHQIERDYPNAVKGITFANGYKEYSSDFLLHAKITDAVMYDKVLQYNTFQKLIQKTKADIVKDHQTDTAYASIINEATAMEYVWDEKGKKFE